MTAEAARGGIRRSKKAGDRRASRRLVEALAVNVRARRKRLRLTVRQASKLAGLNWRHWQKLEVCDLNPTLETLARVAKGLRVKLASLLRAVGS